MTLFPPREPGTAASTGSSWALAALLTRAHRGLFVTPAAEFFPLPPLLTAVLLFSSSGLSDRLDGATSLGW